MQGVKGPLNELPETPEKILSDVDYYLITHIHPDHFTKEYLPKDIKVFAANEKDRNKIQSLGFNNVSIIDDDNTKIEDIQVMKTPGTHGDNKEVALKMGDVSGYLLTGEKESLYIAGDTVFNSGIENFLKKYKPNVIILNCDEATTPEGRLIMNLEDIKSVCDLCPKSTVILSRLDSVNHALLSSEDVRKFVKENHLDNIIVPHNGEWIQI